MHVCTCSSILSLFSWKSSHTCPYSSFGPWIQHVFGRIDSFVLVLEALKLIKFMHVACTSCYWGFVGNGSIWTTFGLWFCKLIFETCHIMSFKVFSRKLAQKDRIWYFKCWVSCLETNLKIPVFGFPARAKDSTRERPSWVQSSARAKEWWLERKLQALRFLVHADARSSEVTYARARTVPHARASVERASSENLCLTLERGSSARRAWISCIQYFCSPLERGNSRSSVALLSACSLE